MPRIARISRIRFWSTLRNSQNSCNSRQEAFLPISAFELAGWAKDPNGKLDLKSIRGMSIGWGGYFGKEGEKVQFTLATPKVGVVEERQ